MTFPDFLRAEVVRLGAGVSSRGETLAAIALGVSPRTIRNWTYQTGATANAAEQAGARVILPQCGQLSAHDNRLKRKPKS